MNKLLKSLQIFLFLAFLTAVLFGLSGCQSKKAGKDLLQVIKERGKIIVGVKYDSKPFGFIDSDNQLKGFDIDLAREIAKIIFGSEDAVEFKQVTSSNRIFSLSSGAVDMVIATMTINAKRQQVIDFSDPYYIAGQAIMVNKHSRIKSLKDLDGRKVIVVLGTTGEKNIRELVPGAKVQGFRTYTDAFSALQAGRADALTTDDTIINGFLSENINYKILGERYTREPYGIGFKKSSETEMFRRAINIALEEIKNDGTLDKLRTKWVKY